MPRSTRLVAAAYGAYVALILHTFWSGFRDGMSDGLQEALADERAAATDAAVRVLADFDDRYRDLLGSSAAHMEHAAAQIMGRLTDVQFAEMPANRATTAVKLRAVALDLRASAEALRS